MLSVRDLTLKYGQSQILNGVTLEARAGEVCCLMGTNGVGKTSLLNAISGTHPRAGGEVTFRDEKLGVLPAHVLARKGIAYVPQGREIFPLMSVQENLETGFACLPRSEQGVPDEIFELFPVLREMKNRRGGDLSGGQQQQLAIGRALVTRPKLLLLDEPTEGIQPNIIQQIGRVIAYLRDQGEMAILLVEQYFDFGYDLADSIYVMKRGQIELQGAKASLSKDSLMGVLSV
jgi:urea transport system ATP-binding protein